MAKTVSDQLVEMLVDAGIKRVYAITGDSLNPVNDAIRRDGKIEWIHVRHEEVAAYAASMDAELNGIGCCMGSSGPGHVHLINGLYDANSAGNPVIAIASTHETNKYGRSYFQYTNPYFLFKDCSKYIEVANTPEQFPYMMQSALQTAISQKGVAVVGLPGDVASANATDTIVSTKNYHTRPVYKPSDDELNQLAGLINKHKKIGIFCGYGCKDAVAEIEQLAETIKAPIGYTFRAKIFFDRGKGSPYAAGMNGLLGQSSGYDLCTESDLLILLGTDFPYDDFYSQKNTIVQIDEKPERIGRRANVDIGLAGDIKDTVNALLPLVKENEDNSFLEKITKDFSKTESRYENFADKQGTEYHVQPEQVAELINDLANDDAIFTVDTGMSCVWAARLIKGKTGRYLTGSFNHGSMANAMPMAIGAAASQPHRQVIALCGDGGISMLLGDLATIMQYQYPIKIIVFNNRSLGMVKLEMEVQGYVDWQTDMVNPQFDKLAELFNIKGFEARHSEQVEQVLKDAFAHNGPALVNIYTNPYSLAMPPNVTGEQIKGFATSIFKKIGKGKFEDIKNMIKSNIDHAKEIF